MQGPDAAHKSGGRIIRGQPGWVGEFGPELLVTAKGGGAMILRGRTVT
jgi:hypothetical protein